MDEAPKTFLEELQSLDEPTKQKVLVVSTIVIMVIVIYFWFAYFNSIVSNSNQVSQSGSAQATQTAQATTTNGPGFWGNVGNGTAIVSQSVWNGIKSFGTIWESPRQYTINGNGK